MLHIINYNSNFDKESWINISCKIIRRIDLTDEILDEFCTNNIISSFMEVVQEIDTPNSITSGLLLLDKVSMLGFRKELAQNCKWVYDVIQEYYDSDQEYIFFDAIDVATFMSKYKKCSKKFSELGMVDYFRGLAKNKKYKKIANKFLDKNT